MTSTSSTSSKLEITPRRSPIDAPDVWVPGSKSISNRALMLAALARGESKLRGVLDSDDTRVMIRALQQVGAEISHSTPTDLVIRGCDGKLRTPSAVIDVHASGTAARFLTALLALVPGTARLDGTERMRQRPIADLADSLAQLGVAITIEGQRGCPPLRVDGGRAFGGTATIDASKSSQYVSALLQIAPYASREVVLKLKDGVLVSRPYVDVTLAVMRTFGAQAAIDEASHTLRASCAPEHRYVGRDYRVEPDASTAAYFFVAAAITGGRAVVRDLPGDSAQADMGLLDVLERMGATVTRASDHIEVRGPSDGLRGVNIDMNSMPDAVLALAVGAAFARGVTHIRNVANLRIKESDRLLALETELRKLGVRADADADSLRIDPGSSPLRGAEIATYDDHRMAMAFALAGLRVPGVVIHDPACVSKSWPGYFDAFAKL
ncbi:MAG TPA: 3-phosphoshikimate 1-carboxyvinyltransferase [Polyangiales bacterium]|nr:3-phosphoshikimate 1-carboxyvinyltransferase [Polyangiales bacterium]